MAAGKCAYLIINQKYVAGKEERQDISSREHCHCYKSIIACGGGEEVACFAFVVSSRFERQVEDSWGKSEGIGGIARKKGKGEKQETIKSSVNCQLSTELISHATIS